MTMQTRELALGKPDLKSRTVPVVLSTDTPVDRGDYVEVLDHSPASIDLSRAPLPLIESHDASGLPIGVVDQLHTDGRKLRGVARFGNSARAQAVLQDVHDGILRSVSVGYEYAGPPVPQGDHKTLRFPFKPLEVSAVSVPADPNAGFFRSYTMHHDQNIEPINTLSRSQRRALREDETEQRTAVEMERLRINEITVLCRTHRIDDATRDEFINAGAPLEQVKAAVLETLRVRGAAEAAMQRMHHDGGAGFPAIVENVRGRAFSLTRAIAAVASGDWSGAGYEREVSRSLAREAGHDNGGLHVPLSELVPRRRDFNTLTPAAGGALVATDLAAAAFIDALRPRSRVIALGATVLSGLVGNVDVPRRSSTLQAQWIGEGAALTAAAATFDTVQLRPKTLGILSQVSRNLLLQGTPDAEMLVRSDMLAQIGLAIDAAAIVGTGASAQPLGLLNMPGVGLVDGGTNGAAVTFDHLIEMASLVAEANADAPGQAFLTHPRVLTALSKLKTTTGAYMWQRGSAAGENFAPAAAQAGAMAAGDAGFSVLGFPLLTSGNVPANLTKGTSTGICSAVLFGVWSELLIGQWGTVEILPNPYASGAYEAGAVQLRVMQTLDVNVRHAESFAVMKDALTA